MRSFKIGVVVDSFKLGLREGLRAAKAVGAEGVQFYAYSSEVSPERLDAAGRRELKSFVADLGLAHSGDLWRHRQFHGFGEEPRTHLSCEGNR